MSTILARRAAGAGLRSARRWAVGVTLAVLTLSACTSTPTGSGLTSSNGNATVSSSGATAPSTQSRAGSAYSGVGSNTSDTAPETTDLSAGNGVKGVSGSTAVTKHSERTTPVPPPGGTGNIHKTDESHAVTTKPPVPLTAKAAFGGKVTARIASVKSIQAKAQSPGEVSGSGVALTIAIENGSAKTINLNLVSVTLTGSDGSPRPSITTTPARPFTGALAAGESASAVYVFTVPASLRKPMTVSVSYTSKAPVVLFRGTPT